ncbi:OsmC family protein [Antarcticibacterium arcticum]|uniref:OsmC family protein n=1 Tax=Antarcticibacterium arcticum TaxID=2585771 RepID=A0A5B8YHL3_9FLAO|nr:bifunctional alpha/beta hydrolase/OsmC family protein [Antarcticibacterium arcticum]QED37294.1 OsmC family protein [Antarcticibacterium arcticum]
MTNTKIFFENGEGNKLAGYLELPLDQKPHNFILMAHCFTCDKNFHRVRNISKSLTLKGFGVLRFDFTGLGESEGDFSDSNFSGNVEDLIAAAGFLKREYKSPSMIIGHSFGGAAAIFASALLPEVKALATIGTPSSLDHVTHLLSEGLEKINKTGQAIVNIGGRPFEIKRQFLEDLETKDLKKVIAGLRKSILILHSPQDNIVEIKNAEELYKAARHPKSFISLDGANHLLSKREDSHYVGEVIGTWAYRYLDIPEAPQPKTTHEVVAQLEEEGFTTYLKAGNHQLIADEPKEFGGSDFGPTPYDYLSAALAACTSMTLQMYARRKKWPVGIVETHVNHSKTHALDCEHCDEGKAKLDTFERIITFTEDLEKEQINRLIEIADKCPVHKTLHNKVNIITGHKTK